MANRSVSVRLTAEVSSYVRELDRAEKATDDLADEIDNLTRSDIDGMAAQAKETADGLEALGDSANETASDVDGLSESVDGLGDSTSKTTKETEAAAKSVDQLEKELVRLKTAFVNARTEQERLDLGKSIREATAQLGDLKKFGGEITRAGRSIGSKLMESAGDAITSSPYLTAAIGGAVVTLAPLLGGVIAGAVTGAVGVGGIVGGVALAARDPRVKAAGAQLGKVMLSSLESDAIVLVAPVLRQIDLIRGRFEGLRPQFQRIFANAGSLLGPLTDDILDGVERLIDGIDVVLQRGGPAIAAFDRLVGDTLETVGEMFAIMSGNSEDAASAIDAFSGIVQWSLESVALAVRSLTDAWGFLTAPIRAVIDATRELNDGYERTEGAIGPVVAKTFEHANSMIAAESAARDEKNALSELAAELRAQTDPVFALMRAQTDLEKAQKGVADAAKKHGRDSPEYQEALRKEAEAALTLVDAAGRVAATSNGQMTPALKAALKQAGLTDQKIADLAKQFRIAEGDARRLADAISAIKSKTVRVHVDQTGDIYYGGGGGRQAPISSRGATGGPVRGPGPKGVDSVEYLLAPGEHIWTAAEVDAVGGHAAMAAMRAAALAGGPSYSAAPAAGAMLMPARGGGGTTTVVHEHRVVLEGRGSLGTLLVNEVRTQAGTKAELKRLLGMAVA